MKRKNEYISLTVKSLPDMRWQSRLDTPRLLVYNIGKISI